MLEPFSVAAAMGAAVGADLVQPLLGRLPQPARRHHEQLVAALEDWAAPSGRRLPCWMTLIDRGLRAAGGRRPPRRASWRRLNCDLQEIGGDPSRALGLDVDDHGVPSAAPPRGSCDRGQRRPGSSVKATTRTKTTSNSSTEPASPPLRGLVARTMGTAPRRPAHERKAQLAPRCAANERAETRTESGRATKVSTSPARSPRGKYRPSEPARRQQQAEHHEQTDLGETRRPSTNERVAARRASARYPARARRRRPRPSPGVQRRECCCTPGSTA